MNSRPWYVTKQKLQEFIRTALQEDIGSGDHSSLGSVPAGQIHRAQLIIKDSGVLAGISLAEEIIHYSLSGYQLDIKCRDGQVVRPGDIGFILEAEARGILGIERLLLNCIQRMSGIATYTAFLSDKIKGTKAKLLDTRKTTPNFRLPEKWAVVIGGGYNHRFGLFDMIMLKDNHIDYAGGVVPCLKEAKKYVATLEQSLKIEIEVRTLQELKQALDEGGMFRVLLDNMSTSDLKEAVELVAGRVETEASGGITEKNIREIALTGVDYISVGALTHSYKSLDISLKAI